MNYPQFTAILFFTLFSPILTECANLNLNMPLITKNKFAYFDYQILEEYEAGIVLTGAEVKSVKLGQIDLKGAYVSLKSQVPYLINAHISPYKMATGSQRNYEPTQARKLLLNKSEIKSLAGKLSARGLTLVPLSVYTVRRLIKIRLGLGRGKKKYDKRETIKKREISRSIARALKR